MKLFALNAGLLRGCSSLCSSDG